MTETTLTYVLSEQTAISHFISAGFEIRHRWQLANGYFPMQEGNDLTDVDRNARYLAQRPWWLLLTQFGPITIGPRKNVFEVDWKGTGLVVPAEQVVKDDNVTRGGTYFHAWTTPKLMEYLFALKAALTEASRIPPCADPVERAINLQRSTGIPLTDDGLRSVWRAAGGNFHGPKIETGTMPESALLPFLGNLLRRCQ